MSPLHPNHPWRLRARARMQRKESKDIRPAVEEPIDEFAEVRTDPTIPRPEEGCE